MQWTRSTRHILDADTGHRITRVHDRGRSRYVAWGPDRAKGWKENAWLVGSIPHWSGQEPKVHYALGEPIPTPRVLLGVYDDVDSAKARCERAWDE